MLINLPYITVANYSPRGQSDLSIKSRRVRDGVKNGNKQAIESAANFLQNNWCDECIPFLNDKTILVPIPRSSPIAEGALWPSLEIANTLLRYGMGGEVARLVNRTTAIRKSHLQSSADTRPTVQEHIQSLIVENQLINRNKIVIIDDVLTMGRTGYACAFLLNQRYPGAEIRFLAVLRTQGFIDNIEALGEISFGTIKYNPTSGKTTRTP